jgi:hypothetical protein
VRDTIPDATAIRGVGRVAFDQSRDAIYGFVQDSWRLGSRFTLDLGLRYEWTDVAQDTALQDLNNFASIFDVRSEVDADGNNIWSSLDPFWQQRILSHVGESLIFKAPKSDKNNFSPRIGFAWDVGGDGKTSIRGGFAWTQDVIFGNLPLLQLPPQAQAENRADSNACLLSPAPRWCAVGGGGLPGGENVRHSTSGYLAGGGLLPAFDPAASEDRDLARSLAGSWVEDDVAPETLTWSLAFQRELAQDLVLEARYIGTQGRKLPVQRWVNAGLSLRVGSRTTASACRSSSTSRTPSGEASPEPRRAPTSRRCVTGSSSPTASSARSPSSPPSASPGTTAAPCPSPSASRTASPSIPTTP